MTSSSDEPLIAPEALKVALDAAQVGVWIWELETDRIRWSRQTAALYGLPADEFEGTFDDFQSRVHPEDRAAVSKALKAALAGEGPVDATHRLAADPARWIYGRGRVLRGPGGKATAVVGAAYDVTSDHERHAALRKSEERYRLFTELASDYVYQVDVRRPELVPRIVAGSFERTTGYAPEDIAELGGWMQVMHPDDRGTVGELTRALQEGQPFVNEYRIVTKNGSERWLRDRAQPIMDPKTGELAEIVGGVQDISDRKRLEEELSHAQKLEALARLAGSVAHDFNNLLTVMMGTSELLAMDLTDESQQSALTDLQRSFAQAAELTSSLLAFARRRPARPVTTLFDRAIESARPTLERAVGERVTVVVRPGAESAVVALDQAQLETALLNLAINAREAMREGGTLELSTGVVHLSEITSEHPAELEPGTYAVLDVSDSGCGIRGEIMAQIFEPFFTTKAKGTGLGLSTVYGILRQLNGAIGVTNHPGGGARFRIYLPVTAGKDGEAQPAPPRHSIGGRESVVVV